MWLDSKLESSYEAAEFLEEHFYCLIASLKCLDAIAARLKEDLGSLKIDFFCLETYLESLGKEILG
jgi:hypothetical protein